MNSLFCILKKAVEEENISDWLQSQACASLSKYFCLSSRYLMPSGVKNLTYCVIYILNGYVMILYNNTDIHDLNILNKESIHKNFKL